jgi:hypothetical protein
MNYSKSEILTAVIIYIVAYLYSLWFATWAHVRTSKLNNLHKSCLYRCPTCTNITKYRGDNYYISIGKGKQSDCLFTFWSFMHMLIYAALGYFCPNLFWETLIAGISFEVFEYGVYDCHDPLDVLYNTIGFGLGYYLRTYIH